jgi:probable HAF family extracellular repeat protein
MKPTLNLPMTLLTRLTRAFGPATRLLAATSVSASLISGALAAPNVPPTAGAATAVQFNGENGYVDVPDGVWFGNTFTVEGWVYLKSYANWSRLFDFGLGAGNENVLGALTQGFGGLPVFAIYQGSSGTKSEITSTQQLPLNTWTHLAFVRDAGGTGRIFINGIERASGSMIAPNNVSRTGNFFGHSNWGADENADGSFADIRVWNVARTAAEITATKGIALPPTTSGLILNYRFNEGWGTTVKDLATADGIQNGTLINDTILIGADAVLGQTIQMDIASNQKVTIANFGQLMSSSAVTIESWVRTDAQVDQTLFFLGNSAGQRVNAHVPWGNGQIFWDFGDITSAGAPGRLAYTPPVSPVGRWDHYAFVSDFGPFTMKVYRNGVLEGSKIGMSHLMPLDGTLEIRPGGARGDFRVWTVGRTPTEIADNMYLRVPQNSTGLLLNLLFSETSGATVVDAATQSGAQNGTLVNSPVLSAAKNAALAAQFTTAVAVTEDSPQLIYLPAADYDSTLTYSSVTATNGTLTQLSGGNFLFTPNANYNGADKVSYSVSDGVSTRANSVNVAVSAVNDPPIVGSATALEFDGVNDHITLGGLGTIQTTYTVEAWVRPDHPTATMSVMGSRAPSDFTFDFKFVGGNKIHGDIGNGTSWITTTADANFNYTAGTWYHVAYVVTMVDYKIFVDGNLVGSGPLNYVSGVPVLCDASHTLRLGSYNGAGEFFKGRIGNVRIWNTARVESYIQYYRHANLPDNTTGLVAQYRMNEGSGTTITDTATSVGGTQNGTLVNGPTWQPFDGPEKSIALNGTTQYGQVLDNAAISITGPITLEAWIRPNTVGGKDLSIINKFGANDGGYGLTLVSAGKIYAVLLDKIGSASSVLGNATIQPNVWTHVAMRWDGALLQVFVNGTLDGTTVTGRNPKDGSTPLYIGMNYNAGAWAFDGRISDVRVWNVARTAAQIAAFRGGVAADAAGLVVNYKFTEGSGSTLTDVATLSGAQNASLIGSPTWPAPEVGLANKQAITYYEDQFVELVLPAFDNDGGALGYSSFSVNSGTLNFISGNLFTYTPAANYNGPVTITYSVSDGTTPVTAKVYLQGIAGEDSPFIASIANQSIGEGSPTTSLGISLNDGDPELTQALTLSATSSDPELIRNPGINYTSPNETAQLTYKPRPGKSGTATITVVAGEPASGLTFTRTFNITVNSVDDWPNAGPATTAQFNGANYVNVPGFGAQLPTDELTVEFWQFVNGLASQTAVVLSPDTTGNRFVIHSPWSTGAVIWDLGNPDAGGRLLYTPPVSIAGSWQHFAFVASKSNNYMKIFRNGIEEASKPGVSSTFLPGTRDLQFGKFAGQLADFRVWKVARTAEEIAAAMHSSLRNDDANLVAYYRFNQKPTTTLTDFASSANQAGAQNGVLVPDGSDNDPIWQTNSVAVPAWQTSVPALKALQVVKIPDGATTNLFLPAWDAENGLTLTWQSVSASTGSVAQVSGGVWAYTAPVGYSGPATINYSVKDTNAVSHVSSASINLNVIVALNDPPTISDVANIAAEEDSPLIEIPFTVDDDQSATALVITPVLLDNAELIQTAAVSTGGNFRSLNLVPKPGEIGTVRIRLHVLDAGGKTAQTEFDLRIEPKPAFSVMDLGVLPGKSASFGTALNDQGAVTGYTTDTADKESNPIGFLFRGIENGGVIENNPLSQIAQATLTSPFRPWAINNDYRLAGTGVNGGQSVAWAKDIEGILSNLGTLPGGTNAEARALNGSGVLAGFGIAANKRRAFLYAPGDAALTDLGLATSPFNDQSDALGLNASNHVVGSVYASDGRRRAMIRKDGVMLPLLSVPNDTNSVAYGINVSDQIVGSATTFVAGDTALSFDGADDYVVQTNLQINLGGAQQVAGNAAHTVEAWIRVNDLPQNRAWPVLVGNLAAGSHHWLVNSAANGGNLQLGLHSSGSANLPLTVGAWMHVAVACAPTSSTSSLLTVYLNGQPYSTNSVGKADLQGIPLKLGQAQSGENFFNGSLDEVRVWNTTRTAEQIAANYTQRLNGDETGLVVYFPFDEGSGTATTTSAADGNLVAQLNGSPTWTVRGGLPAPDLTIGEPALQFDGASSQIIGPSLPLANTSFTVEFSARRAEVGRPDIAVSMGTNTPNLGLHIGFRPENNFTFAFYANDLNAPASASDLAWHHWACSFDATTKARKIYRDGVLVKQDIATANFQGTGPLVIGRIAYSSTWFKGTVDDVRVWSVARTAEEIAANQNVRLPGNTPGLLTYYSFDEGGGNTAANRVAGATAGSLQGAISWSGRDTGSKRAFLYDTESGRLTSLGTVSGGGESEAFAINDFGQTVGTAVKSPGKHAFFYSAGKLNDLNDLLPENEQLDQWVLESATGINRSGAIVGTGKHAGDTRAFLALPATVIGRPVIRPQGAVEKYPQITILKKHLPSDSVINSFYWSEGEKKLYAIRPVTAKIEWFTSFDDIVGTGNDITSNTNRVVSVTVNVWPKQPTIHIAGAPVDLQPAITAAHYTFQSLYYVTNSASVEPSAKVFTSPTPGYTVAFYLRNEGLAVNADQPPYFEVIRTVTHDDSHANLANKDWTIGQEVTEAGHREYNDKNGYVLFEKAAYDGSGTDRAYDRGTRLGPILPVNQEKPGGNLDANPDPLLVVWYRTNRIGVAWASVPVKYSLNWPADGVAEKIIIASQLGSGYLDAADHPAKTFYNQPDKSLPGFNPNEEHAYMPVDTLFALRDDLNDILNFSQPYALLKFRNPTTSRWQMRVFKVVAEEDPYFFRYAGTVGKEVQPPLPISLMPLTDNSYQVPAGSQVGWRDYKGKFYARQAGPEGSHTNLVIRWFYPMQPGFYHPNAGVEVGDALAWLDGRAANALQSPNQEAGTYQRPIDVTYDIRWDETAILQLGESLLHSKRGMPDVFNMANARVIFDSLTGPVAGGTNILARFYDPLSARTITAGVTIPTSIKRQNIIGKEYFTDLPWFLKIRLSYDPINNWLSFNGHLDENFGVGEPLLLPNVLSSRERDRIKKLAEGDSVWSALIDRLYDLTRNPGQLDMEPFDGLPDQTLRLGLVRVTTTNFVEVVGDRKKVVVTRGAPVLDPDTGDVIGYGPSTTSTVYVPESNLPTTIDEARALDARLADDFRRGEFRTADGEPPISSYSIFIGPTTTIETGPKVLTAGLGGIPAAQAKPGNALSFNGTSGLVTITPTNLPPLELTGTPFTIEFWARVTSPTTEQYLFGQPAGSANLGQLRLGFRDGGKFAFDLGTTPASDSIFNTAETYTDTGWHHWAGTFDPETKVQNIYHDGVLVESRTNAALSYVGFGTVELGRFGTQYFGGQLDEVRIWKTARTGSEIRAQMNKRQLGTGVEPRLELLFRCDETAGPLVSDALPVGGYTGALSADVSLVTSEAPTGIPPRYVTIAENNDPTLGGLPVALHVIRVDDGPFLGDLKVLPGDNVFDERLTMRHSSDFGGDPDPVTFQWYFKPIGADFDPTDLPIVSDPNAEFPSDMRGWTVYSGYLPINGAGVNYVTTGEGGESGLITLSDNAFVCRYKGYAVNLNSAAAWSGWVGDPTGTPEQPRAALAEGWVKRVIRGLNPFDARTSDFHSSPSVTYSSMLIQAGSRYEGPIAFNPAADAINKVGLIEAYTTVLERAKGLSIEGVPQVDFNPANNALLLAATKLSDLYTVLGNEAYADASDPTIGFGIGSNEYGSLASSIFAFQNQLDSLLEEELSLLRGRDDSAAGVAARPIYNRLFWNFTLGEGEVAYQQNYNISDQDLNGFIDEKDSRILYPQGHGDAWGHYLTATKQHYALLKHPYFTWIPRSEFVNVAGAAIKVDFLDERKFAVVASAKAKAAAEIVDLTYRLNYVDDPAGQWQGYKDTKADRGWGVTEWARRAGMGAYFDWLTGNTMLPSEDPNPAHTGIDKIDRKTVRELHEISAQYAEIQTRLDQADAGLNPLGLAKGVVPFDIDPSLVGGAAGIAGKTHYEQIQERALKAMNNALSVWNEVNKSTEALRRNQDSVEQFTANVNDQERDYKNRLIEIYGYPHAGDIGAGKTYPSGYDGPDLYHYMYVPVPDFDGMTIRNGLDAKGYFTKMNLGINNVGNTESGAFGTETKVFYFPEDTFAADLLTSSNHLSSSNEVLEVIYPRTTARYAFSTPAAWGVRRAPGEIQMALSDLIQTEARLRASLKAEDALFADIDNQVEMLNARYHLRAETVKLKSDLANTKIAFASTIIALKIGQAIALDIGKTVIRAADAAQEGLPKAVGLATDATSFARSAIKFSGAVVENANSGIAAGLDAAGQVIEKIGLPAAEGIVNSKIEGENFTYEIRLQLAELERALHQVATARIETIRLAEAVNQAGGRYLAALAKGQRLLEERVAYRIRVAAHTTENRYQDMTFRIFRNDALQKYRATFDLAQRYVFLAATAYDYESNLLGTDTRGGRAFLTDIIRQRSLGQMLDGTPVVGRAGLADPLARMGSNFDVLKTQLGFNNPQTETGRFSLRNELFRLRDREDSATGWRTQLNASRVANLWDLPEFRRYCRSFAPESAGAQPGIVIRFPTTVTAGKNFFNWPLGGGDSAYDASRFATKIRSVGVWFTGYNGLGLSQTPRVYLVPAGAEVLSSPTPNDFVTREWRVVDQAVPVPFPIGANRLSDASWIPINDSLGGSFAEVRRFSSFRAYHDSGGFNQSEAINDSRLVGRSVWNKDWLLIIPGQTFLANSNNGLDTFINSVSDIKLFFQTYSYSGN